ncbi:MAG: hypothetical protein RID11_10670 [Roseovarius sp.]|uniref:hypothetical protein n=1 Tax=Roseovarius sp. TaxID=1486281 RepID=UPI0032EE37B2
MARQHCRPIYLNETGSMYGQLANPLSLPEADLQDLVHKHPEALPIEEIDPSFSDPVSICRELNTPAGPIDNFLVTPSGLPILVECKLWRNPQARREVVGQVLDYAKELARWTSADIEREAARRGVPSVIERVRAHAPEIDEAEFNDTLTTSLQSGRCLLLILGDGIREGVEAIFEHLGEQGALHFSFGLVEMPVFELPNGARLATPRIIARTAINVREVVKLPDGYGLKADGSSDGGGIDAETQAMGDDRQSFWRAFLKRLELDDPEQPVPRAPRQGFITFTLPAPGGTSWITVYREMAKGDVGVFLSFTRDTLGQRATEKIVEQTGQEILNDLGGTAFETDRNGIQTFADKRHVGNLSDDAVRDVAIAWLATRTNDFVNVLRPAVRSAILDIQESDE